MSDIIQKHWVVFILWNLFMVFQLIPNNFCKIKRLSFDTTKSRERHNNKRCSPHIQRIAPAANVCVPLPPGLIAGKHKINSLLLGVFSFAGYVLWEVWNASGGKISSVHFYRQLSIHIKKGRAAAKGHQHTLGLAINKKNTDDQRK